MLEKASISAGLNLAYEEPMEIAAEIIQAALELNLYTRRFMPSPDIWH